MMQSYRKKKLAGRSLLSFERFGLHFTQLLGQAISFKTAHASVAMTCLLAGIPGLLQPVGRARDKGQTSWGTVDTVQTSSCTPAREGRRLNMLPTRHVITLWVEGNRG